jgi:hypothetical protein
MRIASWFAMGGALIHLPRKISTWAERSTSITSPTKIRPR